MAMRRVPVRDLVKAKITDEMNIVLAKHGMVVVVEDDRMWIEFAAPPKPRGFVPWGMGIEGPEED